MLVRALPLFHSGSPSSPIAKESGLTARRCEIQFVPEVKTQNLLAWRGTPQTKRWWNRAQ